MQQNVYGKCCPQLSSCKAHFQCGHSFENLTVFFYSLNTYNIFHVLSVINLNYLLVSSTTLVSNVLFTEGRLSFLQSSIKCWTFLSVDDHDGS